MVTLLTCALVLVLACGVGLAWRYHFSEPQAWHVYIAVLSSDDSIQGVLRCRRGPWLVFSEAQLLSQGRSTPLDGEVCLERAQVVFLQRLSRTRAFAPSTTAPPPVEAMPVKTADDEYDRLIGRRSA